MCGFPHHKLGHTHFKNRSQDYSQTTGKQSWSISRNWLVRIQERAGTRDNIVAVRTLAERSVENNKKLYVCYVDYEKAFDRVNWTKIMKILRNIGVDWKDWRLIKNLYALQSAFVVGNLKSDAWVIGRGVRQGCTLSPLLFNLCDEVIMREATMDEDNGVKVGGCLDYSEIGRASCRERV